MEIQDATTSERKKEEKQSKVTRGEVSRSVVSFGTVCLVFIALI